MRRFGVASLVVLAVACGSAADPSGSNGAGPPGAIPPAADAPPGTTSGMEDGKVALPIEIFGADGATKEIAVMLSAANAPRATQVSLRLHNVRYATKASVQVNGGPWVQLSNETTTIAEPARSWGGIGGGFAVLSLTVPLPPGTAKSGSNTIRFRFDKTNGLSMGYRVLAVDLLDAAGVGLLDRAAFAASDPSKWTAPAGGEAATGAVLWREASLSEGPLATRKLKAHCGDCHAEDGRDLKYFNFSNFSVIERARFHGLTEDEGKHIAAYIRASAGPAPGRPWDPPFQPGQGRTARPPAEFSSGAGIDAVVDDDATLAAIFAKGFDRVSLAEGNALRRIPMSDIPVGLQLPDWNHWLPEIHPKDALDGVTDIKVMKGFAGLRDKLAAMTPDALATYRKKLYDTPFLGGDSNLRSDMNGFRQTFYQTNNQILGIPDGVDYKGDWNDLLAKKIYANAVWSQVKTWELMTRFGLETYAADAYPGVGEARAWTSERHLFDTSPFLLGIRGGPSCPSSSTQCRELWTGSSIGNTAKNYDYLSNSWYHLQLMLNAGQRSCGGHRCVDFGYAYGFLNGVVATTGLYEGGRRLLWGVKAMEEHDTGIGPVFYDGFSFATANPFRAIGLGEPVAIAFWTDPAHPNRRKAIEVTGQVWAEKMGSWTVDAWRANYGKGEDGANFLDATRVVDEGSPETRARSLGDGLWHSLPALKELKVHPAVIHALARFGLAMWPANAWLAAASPASGATPGAPSATATATGVTVGWSVPGAAVSMNVYRATNPAGPWLAVALLRPGTSIVDVPPKKGATYVYAVSANGAETESSLSPGSQVAY